MANLSFWISDYLQYRIRFQHVTPQQVDKHDPEKRKPNTTCFIQKREVGKGEQDWTTLSIATVRLHNGDSWNRTLGRQYAFEKAMEAMLHEDFGLDRPVRTALWKQFWTICKQNTKLKKIKEATK